MHQDERQTVQFNSRTPECAADAPRTLVLSGDVKHQHVDCLGTYQLVAERTAYAQPVWKHAISNWWIARSATRVWSVQQGKDVGVNNKGCIFLNDECRVPAPVARHVSSS